MLPYRVTSHRSLWSVILCLLSLPGFAQTIHFNDALEEDNQILWAPGENPYVNNGISFELIQFTDPNARIRLTHTNGSAGSKAIRIYAINVEGVKGWKIKKQDGSAFQFTSIWLQNGCPDCSPNGTITAFRNNVQVGTPVNVTFDSGTTGVKSFASNPDFYDVDEIRIEADDLYIILDDFTYGDAISVGDDDPPVVTGISLVGTPFSTVTSVDFTVTFSKNAKNVSTDDFQLTTAGTVGNIASVTDMGGSTYTVTVNGIDGEGTIRLDLKAGTDIANEDDVTGTPAYTGGQLHYVGSCYTETFENIADEATIFTSNGRAFTLGAGLEVENRANFGAGPSHRYIMNNYIPGTYTITADEAVTMGSVDLFLSDANPANLNPTNIGILTIVGRLDGSEQFTITKNSGFPTTTAVNNGFFTVNFATDGDANYANINIDELVFTIADGFAELNIDNFNFCEAAPEVDNQAPAIQSLTVLGTPESTAGMVNFQAVFNEIALNVTLDDFSLHTTGTATGTLVNISGSGTTYTLDVTGISGEGTIQVRLNSGTDIADELGNTPPFEYVNGQAHYVGACYVEIFEAFTDGVKAFVSNGKNFSLTGSWEVHRQSGFGIHASDVFLLNTGSGSYTLNADDVPIAFSQLALYLSSIPGGTTPTNDGTLTIRGKNGATTVYEMTKSTGFPIDFGSTNGFFFIDFAADGDDDYSGVFVDALEIELGGNFAYMALDNLGYCSDFEAPSGYTVAIDQNPITPVNESAVSFTFADAEIGTTYHYIFTSSGGGTPVSDSGTISTATDQISGIDLSDLAAGTITLSVTLTDPSGNTGIAATSEVEKIENKVPTAVGLSDNTINQSDGINAEVGTLSTEDEDEDNIHSYTLVSGTGDDDNGFFNIAGDKLQANNAAALAAGTYSVLIQTDDQRGGTFEQAFSITVVDDIAPTVNNVAVPANGTYPTGQNLDFTVNVSEAVAVTGTPRIALTIGSTSVNAIYHAGGSTATGLVFRYTVQSGETDTDGITVGASIDLNGGTITDGADLPLTLTLNSVGSTTGVVVDGVAPSVTGVNVPGDDTYALGETLSFTVNFSENVAVNTTGGTPRIPLTIGAGTRYATYVSNPAFDLLLFTYTVGAGDHDTDGISVGTHIELNGGVIQDIAGNAATLTLNAIGATDDVRVDGVAPTVSTFSPANGSADVKPDDNLLITFSENIAFGTGSIVIYDEAATPIATINVGSHSGQLSIADEVLTINPTADLLELTDYYVHIGDDAIHDLVGNAYVGINDNTTWAFTVTDVTAPSGYAVSIDQAEITLANQTGLSFTFSGAELGTTFGYTITSSGGGTPVTGSGSVSTASQQVSGIDVSGLPNGTLTLNATLTDNIGNEGTPVTDNVTKAVNHPPVITTSGGVTTFTESVAGDPEPEIIDPALTVSDADHGTLVSATVTITGNFQPGEDVLDFVNDGGNTGDIDGNYVSGVLTLTSPSTTATLAEWQAALRSVTYSNTSNTPNTANRTISFVANDGTDDGAAATKIVAVQAVNNAPIITNLDGDAVTFTEGGPAVLIDAGGNATVSDSDSPDLNGGNLTVAIVANEVAGEDILAIRNEGMAAGQIGIMGGDVHYGGIHIGLLIGGTGGVDLMVTFLPTATPTAAQALIRNLTYSNSHTTAPTVDPRTIRVTLNDGDGATSVASEVTVNMIAVNDAPTVTTSGGTTAFTEPEDGDPVPVTIDPGLTVADPDNGTLVSATVHITGNFEEDEDLLAFENDGSTMGDIGGSYDDATGVLTLTSAGATATLAEWEAALRTVTYSNGSQNPNTAARTISFRVDDGTDQSTPATKTVNVFAVNTAPIAVDDEVTVTEDTPATGNVLTNDSDVEGNVLTASLVTAPVNGTVVLNADGSFTYTPIGDYAGLDSLEYQACDNGTPTRCDSAWVRFTVEAVNDAPVITAPATIAANEDIRTPLTGISFADVDAGSADVTATFSVASGTLSATSGGGVTAGGSETGMLTLVGAIADLNAFVAAGNISFTTALDETDDVTLTVHIDDGGNTGIDPGNSGTDDSEAATTTVTITVTALNDAPVNAVPVSQTIDQNGTLVFSTGNGNAISVSDVDAGGGVIRVTLTAMNGLLTLSGTAGLNFLAGSGTGDGTLTFDGTFADINQALNGLAFVPISGYNGPASLQITTDDLGLTGSDGPKTDTDLIDITVNPVNPTVIAVGSTSSDGTYKINEVIHVTVTFDQMVTVDETGGSPSLLLETGDADREAIYASGSGNNVLTFSYTVQVGDVSTDLDYVSTAALLLNGATIQNASSNDAVLELPTVGGTHSIAGQHDIVIDGIAPAVTSVTVPANGYHVENDPLDFTVHFSESVAVDETGGTPHLEVTIGTTTVQAAYVGGSGSNALAFRYVIQAGDADLDGIDVGGSLVLDGGTIRDAAGNDASSGLNNIGLTDDIWVYAVHPSVALSTETLSPVNAPFTLVVAFNEPVTGFTVGGITASNAAVSNLQTADHITYTALVTPTADGAVSVHVPADAAQNVANNGNTASNTLSLTYDGTAPVVTAVDVPANGYYREGDVLAFTVYMDDEVVVNTDGGMPYLTVTIGAAAKQAIYVNSIGTDALIFSYTVQADDQDLDGIALGSDLVLNGGTIRDAAGNDVDLTLNSVAPTGGIFVYSVTPTVTLSTEAVTPVNSPFTVTVTFSEVITDFTLDDIDATNARVGDLQTTDNKIYTVLVTPSVGGMVQLSVPANAAFNMANNGNQVSNTLSVAYRESITGITFEDGTFVYDGTAKSLAITGALPEGITVSYANNGRTNVGAQEVTATLSGNNYENLVLTATLTITPASRTLHFPALPDKAYGDADFDAGATASSRETVIYTSSNPAVAEVRADGTVSIIGAGETIIMATVAENGNYANRPEATQMLTVRKAAQAITLNAPGEVSRDVGSVALEVSASSGLPVELLVDDPEVAVLAGTSLDVLRLGTVRVTATQGGGANHEPAEPVTVVIRVIDPASDMPIRIHKAVSPNGDGINEYLIIEAIKDYPDNRVRIFNRNGTVVWEASGYNNGTVAFRGIGTGQHLVPAGTYFYVAEISANGEWKYEKGWFLLRY